MADNPTGEAGGSSLGGAGGTSSPGGAGGAGGAADEAAQEEAAAVVGRASAGTETAAKKSKAGHDEAPRTKGGSSDESEIASEEQVHSAEPAAPATPAMGAGGTSEAASEDDTGSEVGAGMGGKSKAAAATAAVPAAGAAGQMMILAMFINWLKGMMAMMAAIAMNLWNMFMAAVLAGMKAVLGMVMSVGGVITGLVGGGISALSAGVSFLGGLLVASVVMVAGVIGVTDASSAAQRDGGELPSCTVQANADLESIEGSEGSADANSLANAQTVFSVLSAWGMPDENIAGIVGNWDAESRVDPTSVEGIFSEPFHIGPRKQAAWDTEFDHMGYVAHSGIGLGQWTNGRNLKLRAYADKHDIPWHTMQTQLGFMISADEGRDALVVKDMIATPYGTPAQAAKHFHDKWERSADTEAMAARRGENAVKWMGMFSGWEIDQALADSILAQAGTTVGEANSSRAQSVRSDCIGADQGALTMTEGGLTLEQATELMAVYREEGENFLVSRYASGGPGKCAGGKADNCVGFSTYFVNKFTSFQKYAPGNGSKTASSMAGLMGKEVTTTPTAYSVASGPGSGVEGHTFVVLGIQGDQAVIGEAACGSMHKYTRARMMPLSELTSGVWTFVDVTDLMVTGPVG